MKRLTLFNKILSVVVVAIMTTATAVSFAYWKTGIEGSEKQHDLTVTIGKGNSYVTVVSLSDISRDTYSKLIPQDRTPQANETTMITFTMKVNWLPEYEPSNEFFEAEIAWLNIEVLNIKTQDDDLTLAQGFGYKPLFECDITYPDTILGNDSVDVTFKIKMNEPANKEQYNMVADKDVSFTLKFSVKTQDDIDQLQQ